jgi:hypothetical protein
MTRMEIHLLQSLIAEGRYEVEPHLVAEAIVDRLGLGKPLENPAFGTRRPAQLQFDPRVVPPTYR